MIKLADSEVVVADSLHYSSKPLSVQPVKYRAIAHSARVTGYADVIPGDLIAPFSDFWLEQFPFCSRSIRNKPSTFASVTHQSEKRGLVKSDAVY
jgi:hypothetical protein